MRRKLALKDHYHWLLLAARGLIISIALLGSQLSWALPEDREKPIRIESDNAEIDDQKGIAIYRGDVKMKQGTIKLKADRVEVFNEGEGVNRVLAYGNPAHYQELPKPEDDIMHAYGDIIEYYVVDERIKLKNNARVIQNETTFTGKTIDYDMRNGLVNASGGSTTRSTKSNRVEMVIQPGKLNRDNEESSDTQNNNQNTSEQN